MRPADRLRQPIRFLVFSASLRRDSLNSRLADLAAAVIEANGGTVDAATMRDFDTPSASPSMAGGNRGLFAGPRRMRRRGRTAAARRDSAPDEAHPS
jgi:chromate reductase, NAD(P)H dehydrogenase (quinone)